MDAQATIEDREHDAKRVGGADLAIDLALLHPDAAFVRERSGAGTSMMRRELDGSWYFVD